MVNRWSYIGELLAPHVDLGRAETHFEFRIHYFHDWSHACSLDTQQRTSEFVLLGADRASD